MSRQMMQPADAGQDVHSDQRKRERLDDPQGPTIETVIKRELAIREHITGEERTEQAICDALIGLRPTQQTREAMSWLKRDGEIAVENKQWSIDDE